MRSVKYGPTARKDGAGNWLFTSDVLKAYKHNIDVTFPGAEFQFSNGPYGGGRKFEIVDYDILHDLIIAKEK